MADPTFSYLFCERNHVPVERYEKAVLARCLYPHARWFYHLIRFFRPHHFAADYDLVRNVATLRRFREFSNDVQQYMHHPANRGMLRRTFNVRISTKQLRRLVRSTLHPNMNGPQDEGTAAPFGADGGKPAGSEAKPNNSLGVAG